MPNISISVIISTYNAVDWLEKVIYGYNNQTFKKFEVVIADDGSDNQTKQRIKQLKKETFFTIQHIWHPDNGFQKTKILNKALIACTAPYIVMTDGDCIPRADFLQVHNTHKQPNYFLSGGYFKFPMSISKLISKIEIQNQDCFNLKWLKGNGLKSAFKNTKLTHNKVLASLLNKITPTTPSWNGHNASGWKKDMLAINGFDERMQYGGEDREFGERLVNMGIQPIQIRYHAICIHLDHKRGYVAEEMIDKNHLIRQNTKENKIVKTAYGIKKLEEI